MSETPTPPDGPGIGDEGAGRAGPSGSGTGRGASPTGDSPQAGPLRGTQPSDPVTPPGPPGGSLPAGPPQGPPQPPGPPAPPGAGGTQGGGRIVQVDLREEMGRSYLDYAMSVIVGRALPDVRDGLKPVHRRVLYAMFDGGFRPDRGFNKCARIVGDVMGNYHPHGDTAIYDALVRLAQPWSMRYRLVDGQGNFGSPGNDRAAAMRYTECKMAALAMEMVRDIDRDTVDFVPNYDGKSAEPLVLPSRFPNLLVNGSAGIAVGMATNIPPHNLREVAAGVQWSLEHPDASREELLAALIERIPGPDFPTGALIVGRGGILDAYRTGRGSVTMRAVVEVEEDAKGRVCLVVTELPYQVNPDNLALKIAELVNDGKLAGIAELRDDSSGRTGRRLVIVLKRDAVASVVRNNLFKHTQLQETFGCNMVALVDNVPRTLSIDLFVKHWIAHQIEHIQRRTRFNLREAEKRAHLLRGYVKALDALDEVIALIRRSPTVEEARTGLMELLDVDEVQATGILDMQLRRLAALERQRIIDQLVEIEAEIADLQAILASEERQRLIVSEELAAIVDRYGDDRRTRLVAAEGEMSAEDFIPEEDVVITITRGGYAKRTKTDLYRSQRRGGKGVRGASLREDDVVEHFFTTTTHQWLLFFTNQGRVYRAKAYQVPEAGRDAKGQHVANLLAFQPDEVIAQVLDIRNYDAAPYLVLATRAGLAKKSYLALYDSPRQGGIQAIVLRDETDEVIGAELVTAADDLLLVSRKGMAVRFAADDDQLRPMGRTTSGVTGMRFRPGDELLSLSAIRSTDEAGGRYVFTVTDGGYAKKTPIQEYRVQGRGGLGIKAMKLNTDRGSLVGALVVSDRDDVLTIKASGGVTRSSVGEVPAKGRDTMGVKYVSLAPDDTVVAMARNAELAPPDDQENEDGGAPSGPSQGVPDDGLAVDAPEAAESGTPAPDPEGDET